MRNKLIVSPPQVRWSKNLLRLVHIIEFWQNARHGGAGNQAYRMTTSAKCGRPRKNSANEAMHAPDRKRRFARLFYLWGGSKAVYKGILLQNCFCSIILSSDRCWDSGWRRATSLTPRPKQR